MNSRALLVARAQTDPTKYKSIMSGFSVTVKEQGMASSTLALDMGDVEMVDDLDCASMDDGE